MAKGSIKKKIGCLLVLLAVVAAVGIGALIMSVNSITKTAIEESLSFVLQVDVTLDKAKVSLLKGKIELFDLKIPNPEGFDSPNAITCDYVHLKADLGSLRTDKPRIEVIAIEKPKITLEQDMLDINLKKLIDSASRFSTGGAEPDPAEEEEETKGNKTVVIDLVRVEATAVEFVAPMMSKGAKLTLPTIELKDIGKEKEEEATLAEVITETLKKLLAATLEMGKDIIPVDFQEGLKKIKGLGAELGKGLDKATDALQDGANSALEAVKENVNTEKLKEGAGALTDSVKEGAGAVTDNLKEGAGAVTDNLKGGAEKAKEGLKGLFK